MALQEYKGLMGLKEWVVFTTRPVRGEAVAMFSGLGMSFDSFGEVLAKVEVRPPRDKQ